MLFAPKVHTNKKGLIPSVVQFTVSPRYPSASGANVKQSLLYINLIYNKILYVLMKQEMIQISKEEYFKLKKLEKLDFDLIRQFASSLEDLKHG